MPSPRARTFLIALATWSCLTSASAEPYTWRSVPFGAGGFVDGFVYHPTQKGLLYARTDIGGMYRYDPAARRWLPLLDHLGHDDAALMGVLSIAVDPHDPSKLYAATGLYLGERARKGAILRSDDQGRSWHRTELPIHVGGNSDGRGSGERLAVDPRDGKTIYYGSNQDGLWKSTDGGNSFSQQAARPQSISFVLPDPSTAGTLYAGSADGKGSLMVSRDGGAHFARVDGTPDQVPQHAAFDPDGALYVSFAQGDGAHTVNPSFALRGGVWKREPQSGKWRDISPVHGDGGYSGVDVARDGTVAVSTLDRWHPGDDIYLSRDGGAHWAALSGRSRHDARPYPWLVNYMRGQDTMGHWIADLKLNPFNSNELVYGTGYGVWMSRNLADQGPVQFDFEVTDLEEGAVLQLVSPTGGANVFAAFGDVGGAAWDDTSKTPSAGLFTPTRENNFSVDYAGLDPAIVARTAASAPFGHLSDNGGARWTAVASVPPNVAAGRDPGVLAVSAKASALLWAPHKEAAYYSLDHGKSWKLSAGWPADRSHELTPLSDKTIDNVFYVYDRANVSVLASADGGATFKPIVQALPTLADWQSAQLAVVPGRARDLWLAMPTGLLHTRDGGSPMKAVPHVDQAWLVTVGAPPQPGGYPAVYLWGRVDGREGLWRSDDEARNWTRINDEAHQFGRLRAIAGDMLEYGTLYVAPEGRGVMIAKPVR